MSLYENIKCPVCKNEFVDGDDIVVCPVCGTPHHRDCYNMIGHCVNQGLHESGYTFKQEQKDKVKKIELENTPQKKESNVYYQPSDDNSNHQGEAPQAEQAPPVFFAPPVDQESKKYNDDKSTIDGFSVSDIAGVVRIKPGYFVPKFKALADKKVKFSWNGSGFIFGSLYLLYRKMFKEGMAVFAVILSLFYGSNALIFKFAPNFTQAVKDLASSSLSGLYPTNEQMQSIMHTSDVKTAVMITYGTIALIILVHFIVGIMANGIYKKSVFNIIKKVDEQLDDDNFAQPKIFIADSNVPKDQLRKMFFARRGGVSFFAPSMAVMLLLLIL